MIKNGIMNKKGWILIIEAVIAVLILFGFLFITISKQAQELKILEEKPIFYNVAARLVSVAEKNETIRNYILAENEAEVNNSLKNELARINPGLNLDVKIKGSNEICSSTLKEKEIYVADAIIAANLTNYELKKLCVFVWEK